MIKKIKNKIFNGKSNGKEKLISISKDDSPLDIAKNIRKIKYDISKYFKIDKDKVLITPFCDYKFHLQSLSLENIKTMFDLANINHLQNVNLIIKNNITSPEVEKYLNKAKHQFEQRTNQSIESEAFKQLDTDSKKDFLQIDKSNFVRHYIEFSPQLYHLLEPPVNNDKFIEIINEIGINNIECFVHYYKKLGEVKIKKKKDKWSDSFNDLTEKEIFLRGEDIPISELIDLVSLSDLNYILLAFKHKELVNKKEALAILKNRSDSYDILSQKIPIEDCFMINIENKLNNKLKAEWIINSFLYYEAYEDIIFKTFDKAFDYSMGYTDKFFYEFNSCCRKSAHLDKEELSVDEIPKLPLHPGCSCWCEVKNKDELVMKF